MQELDSFVALGDSFTEGMDDPAPNGTYVGWADRLAGMISTRQEGFRYANLAIRGKTLQEIVDALVSELGFDGGLGSAAEVENGVYTGRIERRLDGTAKAAALEELAVTEGIDLRQSTAYSDSASDVPFLEAVGRAVAVNPDRRLREIAAERGWRVLRFRAKAFRGR